MHVLIVGDSHTGALELGRALLAGRGALPEGIDWRIQPLGSGQRMGGAFWREEAGRAVLADDTYAKRLAFLPPDDPRPDAIGLSMPLWSGRVMRDFLTAGQMPYGLDAPGRQISTALLSHLVRADQQHVLALARFLVARGVPVFAIEPPGVFRDYRLLMRAEPQHVLALQARIRAAQRTALAEAGIADVPLPAATIDAEGFMKNAYRTEDLTDTHHANAEFGALRLAQIADFLRGPGGLLTTETAKAAP